MHIKALGDQKKKLHRYKMGNHSLGTRITGKDFGDIAYSNIINVNQECDVVKKNLHFILRGISSCVIHSTGNNYSALSRSSEASAKAMCLILGITLYERCRQVRKISE